MHALKELREMLEDEVKKIVKKGDINQSELETVYKVIDVIKDIDTIKAMEEAGGEDGYSERYMRNSYGGRGSGNYRDGGSSYDGSSYDGYSDEGSSYRRGRSRYSRDGGNSGNYRDGGQSMNYRDGYSGAEEKEQMVRKLEMMMEKATSSKEREAIQRCIEQLDA